MRRTWNPAGAILAFTTLAGAAEAAPPASLRETGLYADWESKTVAEDVLTFTPQYALWSDGAAKRRFLHLPAGTWIDGSQPEVWRYPVGTRLWKEFRIAGQRVETRLSELTPEGWQFAAYVWNADGSEAPLAPARGLARSVEVAPGIQHAIPGEIECRACHEGGASPVLGLGALQLSPDRDPDAPHAELPAPGDVDLRVLVTRGLLRGLPAHLLEKAPRTPGSPAARAALGWLHANCSACHNGSGPLAPLGLSFEHSLDASEASQEPALLTTLGLPSQFTLPGAAPGELHRIAAGEPGRSVVPSRVNSRNPLLQMPPLGRRLVDEEAVALLNRFIAELPSVSQ
jgi:hypothetical protein